jgi:hypothetical protein
MSQNEKILTLMRRHFGNKEYRGHYTKFIVNKIFVLEENNILKFNIDYDIYFVNEAWVWESRKMEREFVDKLISYFGFNYDNYKTNMKRFEYWRDFVPQR